MTEKVSMQHWNGNQICAIDVETTGLDADYHELIEICILPLDVHLNPRKDIIPFNIYVCPEHPERIDRKATGCHGAKLANIVNKGFDRLAAIDMLGTWMDKLGLPLNKSTVAPRRCKIIPLGHNYPFDQKFISKWLGPDQYNDWFFGHFRDTMQIALFLNDHAAQHGEPVPYSKLTLGSIATQHNIEHGRLHEALTDCAVTAEVYKKLISRGLFA